MRYALEYCLLSLRQIVQYKSNFVMIVYANLIHYGVSIVLISFMMSRFKSMNGWSLQDVLLLYAFALLSFSIFGLFFQQLANFSSLVLSGRLDALLLRPRTVIGQVVLGGLNPIYLSHFCFAVSVWSFVVWSYGYTFTLAQSAFLASAVLCGAIIQFSLGLLAASISVLTLDSTSAINLFIYSPRELIWYPISIYPSEIQFIITFIIPVAFISYFPLGYVLGLNSTIDPYLPLGIYPVTAGIALAAAAAWRFVLSQYSSTGS
jgi:ABC-2 type transport system permease protein